MTDLELDYHAPLLLATIHIISGWTLPSGNNYNIIEIQFRKLLLEEYNELNPDEIEYAFRTRSDTVEDWGKNMNLGLINRILKPYLKERYYISDLESRLKNNDDGFCSKSAKDYWRRTIEESYQDYIQSKKPYLFHYMVNILMEDEILYQDGVNEAQLLPVEEKMELLKRAFKTAKANGLKNIYQPEK